MGAIQEENENNWQVHLKEAVEGDYSEIQYQVVNRQYQTSCVLQCETEECLVLKMKFDWEEEISDWM